MTTANPLVKRCYTMSEPHLSGHRVILGFNTMQEAQDAHEFIANIRPSPADAPCQSAGAVAPGECVSVPDERAELYRAAIGDRHDITADQIVIYCDANKPGNALLQLADRLEAAVSGMQPPNNQPNLICKSCGVDRSKEDCKGDRLRCGLAGIAYSDHVAVIGAKPDSVHLDKPAETSTDTSVAQEPIQIAHAAIDLMTWFHEQAEPDDTPDMNATFPAAAFKRFVDEHARLMFRIAQYEKSPTEPAYLRLRWRADELCAAIGMHGSIGARDGRVQALLDALYGTDDSSPGTAKPVYLSAQSGISSTPFRPNEKDVVGEGKQ